MIIEEDGSIQHMKLFWSPAEIPKDSGVSVNTLVDGPLDLVDFTSEDGRNSGLTTSVLRIRSTSEVMPRPTPSRSANVMLGNFITGSHSLLKKSSAGEADALLSCLFPSLERGTYRGLGGRVPSGGLQGPRGRVSAAAENSLHYAGNYACMLFL